MGNSSSYLIDSWEGLDKTLEKPLTVLNIRADKEFFDFYSMQLLAGEWVNAKTKVFHANIMESTARKMGWTPEEAIGKQMYHTNKKVTPITITGVLKDCAFTSPSNDIPDVVFTNTLYSKYEWERCFVLFKFQPGTWEKCRQMIEEMQQNELPDRKLLLYNEEEVFNSYLKSEDTLSRILNLASLVCILISIFGIYSLITLTCEQRRKEIAIRKVNGAKISNILQMFFKEYMLLLTIASLVAFPASYAVMKQWLETYNRQTEIGAWVFITIFIGFAVVIIGSIGYRVWKAANENPAVVVKSE
jgi:ABC-type antimicrobial peptide transport system permease subunit